MARQVVVEIVGDSKKFTKSIDDATTKSKGFGSILQGIGTGVGLGIFNVATSAISGTVGALGDAITKASDFNETVSKTRQIFGSQATPALVQWADTAAKTFGQSQNQALAAASTFAVFGKSAGLAGDDLTGFSKEMVTLASDMASFNNTSPEQAIDAIGAALRGEAEPIRAYGVLLNDATLKNQALEMGLISSTKNALTPQQKVLAAHAVILKQTTDQQGDFARTSDGMANSQRILAASVEDAQSKIGQKLLPVINTVMQFVVSDLLPALEGLITTFSNIWKAIEPGVKDIMKDLVPAFKTVASFIGGTLIPIIVKVAQTVLPPLWQAIKTVASIAVPAFSTVIDIVGRMVSYVQGAINTAIKVFQNLQTAWNTVTTGIKNGITSFIGFFTNLPSRIASAVSGLFDGIPKAFKAALNFLIRMWNNLDFTLGPFDLGPLGKVGPWTLGTPNLPYFHQGGVVPGTPGSDVPIMAQAGETVIPAGKGGGVVINFNGPVYGDDRFIDEFTKKVAQRLYATT